MSKLDRLSAREREVFTLIAEGIRPYEIAARLHVSVGTITTYRANIRQKLDVRGGTAELVTLFHAERLRAAEDHALLAAALCAKVARWEPFTSDPTRRSGEVCACGLRYCTSLDEHGVPILTNLLRDALRINMPTTRKAA